MACPAATVEVRGGAVPGEARAELLSCDVNDDARDDVAVSGSAEPSSEQVEGLRRAKPAATSNTGAEPWGESGWVMVVQLAGPGGGDAVVAEQPKLLMVSCGTVLTGYVDS